VLAPAGLGPHIPPPLDGILARGTVSRTQRKAPSGFAFEATPPCFIPQPNPFEAF